MPAVPIIAAVGATVAAGATVVSAINAGKARREAAQQYKFERQLATNRAARERTNTIRAARLQTGALLQSAETSGVANGSAALGAYGSIVSQLNTSLSFLDTNQKLADAAGFHGSQANIYRSRADTFSGIASAGMSIFGAAGGFNAFGGGSKGG